MSQYSQENTCVGLLFKEVSALLKRDSNTGVPVNIAKFLRSFFIEHIQWLLLKTENEMIRIKFECQEYNTEWKIFLLCVSRAQALDDKDAEILYHLSMNLALSKQVNPHYQLFQRY